MACRRVIIAGERVVKDFLGGHFFSLIDVSSWLIELTGSDSSQGEIAQKVAVPSMAPTPNNTPRKAAEKKSNY